MVQLTTVYSFILTEDITAPAARIWQALCDPTEVVRWDSGVAGPLDAPGDYPKAGQHVRWRYRHPLFHILHDWPQEVVAEQKLHSLLAVGPFRFDETYILQPSGAGCRLVVDIEVRAAIPMFGAIVERAYIGPVTRRTVAGSIRALKRHCEQRFEQLKTLERGHEPRAD